MLDSSSRDSAGHHRDRGLHGVGGGSDDGGPPAEPLHVDAIGQFASLLSGLGQAQAAAPVQTAVAPTLVPAQAAYAPSYAPVVAQNGYTQVAPTVGFRALALGWNTNGAWVVRTFPTLAGASIDALRTCNDQFGGCVLSDAVVGVATASR